MRVDSPCNAFLVRGHTETVAEIREQLDPLAAVANRQRSKRQGRKPTAWARRYQAWLARTEAGEHLADILTQEGIADADERHNVRRNFDRWKARRR
jgi:hypothetical protein